jgi:hypothetical protein
MKILRDIFELIIADTNNKNIMRAIKLFVKH